MTLRQGFIRSVLIFGVAAALLTVPLVLATWFVDRAHKLSQPLARVDYQSHVAPPSNASAPLPPRLQTLVQSDTRFSGPIPRVFLTRLPETLPEITNANERKSVFALTLLPLILRSNELLAEERKRAIGLFSALEDGEDLSERDQTWLSDQMSRYRVKEEGPLSEQADKLLYKMDIIPPSLALAQGAMESGWGTSYFSQEGNALFGEWVWGDEKGLTPRERDPGKSHKVKSFDYLLDSVRSYMVNLNRHPVYEDLRARRLELRSHNLPVTGAALAPALVDYSERGTDYVNDILAIIRFNGFDALDTLELAEHSFAEAS